MPISHTLARQVAGRDRLLTRALRAAAKLLADATAAGLTPSRRRYRRKAKAKTATPKTTKSPKSTTTASTKTKSRPKNPLAKTHEEE